VSGPFNEHDDPKAEFWYKLRSAVAVILSLAVTLYNLQPGGTVTDIDIANRMITIHILDARDEAQIQREIDAVSRLESSMIEIFERSHP